MNTTSTNQLMVIIAGVTAYIVWLIVFLLVIEHWLRHLTEWLFGVTIKHEFVRLEGPSGNINLLDWLFVFGWTVVEPASLSRRFVIGFLRFACWLVALALPIIFGVLLYLWIKSLAQ